MKKYFIEFSDDGTRLLASLDNISCIRVNCYGQVVITIDKYEYTVDDSLETVINKIKAVSIIINNNNYNTITSTSSSSESNDDKPVLICEDDKHKDVTDLNISWYEERI